MMCNIKDNKMLQGNKLVTIKRGMVHTSEVKLSERWNVSRRTVTNFLNLLQSDNMIKLQKSKNGTTLEVLNYNAYQDISSQKRATHDTTDVATYDADSVADDVADNITDGVADDVAQKKNGKKEKNVKNDKNGKEGKEIKELLDAYASPGTELRDSLDAFLKTRKAIKKPVTTTRALKGLLNKLDTLSAGDEFTKIAIVDQSTTHNWQGFFELKTDSGQGFNYNKSFPQEEQNGTYSDIYNDLE